MQGRLHSAEFTVPRLTPSVQGDSLPRWMRNGNDDLLAGLTHKMRNWNNGPLANRVTSSERSDQPSLPIRTMDPSTLSKNVTRAPSRYSIRPTSYETESALTNGRELFLFSDCRNSRSSKGTRRGRGGRGDGLPHYPCDLSISSKTRTNTGGLTSPPRQHGCFPDVPRFTWDKSLLGMGCRNIC